ncbi:MAG: ABC transporter permease [Tropicimonas sp.]|uniref:ABC transporter permease n=1 Tax=Tropicimonas sp. TaxID=2067044 RepID=UPI003A8B2F94
MSDTTAPAPAKRQTPLTRQIRKFRRGKTGMTGLVIVGIYLLLAALAPFLGLPHPEDVDLYNVATPPDAAHWMGTDQFGRDILSRVLYGARTSLLLGFCVVGIATVAGTALGATAGYFRGRYERFIVFCTDVVMTLPTLIIALVVITVLGSGLRATILAIGIAATPRLIRIARGSVIQVREMDFVDSARSLGARDSTILTRHVLPNSLAPIIVQSSLLMAEAVLVGAGLGFLGLGVAPPIAEWGQMLAEGRGLLRSAPHVSVFPGLAIIGLVLGFNLLGDGLRDAFNVRSR